MNIVLIVLIVALFVTKLQPMLQFSVPLSRRLLPLLLITERLRPSLRRSRPQRTEPTAPTRRPRSQRSSPPTETPTKLRRRRKLPRRSPRKPPRSQLRSPLRKPPRGKLTLPARTRQLRRLPNWRRRQPRLWLRLNRVCPRSLWQRLRPPLR